MVRKLYFALAAFSVMSMAGCQNEKIEQPEEGKRTHRLVVNAYPDSETKTQVTAVSGGYQINWSVGDFITLHECAPKAAEDDYDAVRSYESEGLAAEDITDGKAAFTFEVEDRTAEGAEYSYIATYGSHAYGWYSDWSTDDYLYKEWTDAFGYEGEYVEPHMVIQMSFPTYQTPLADSFDPEADLMVSRMQTEMEQLAGETSFRFARLGATVKMTLGGLSDYKGYTATGIYISFGESFQIPEMIKYDPVLNRYVAAGYDARSGGMPSYMEICGDNITIREDGTADVWFRVPSGVLSDWFRVDINLTKDSESQSLAQFIDLTDGSRLLIFKEGGMTTFSVGGFAVADVCPVGQIEYEVNADKDGFTAKWDAVENASGYECFIESSSGVRTVLEATDNGDGTCSAAVASGMEKDTYTIYVRPIPAAGHELETSDYSTETLLIGIPTVYWFSHTTFSDDCTYIEGTEYEYIIGEYSPGKVRFKNLSKTYDSSWTALKATGEWFMYSTQPLEMHSIEIWSKDDSHNNFKVYASSEPGAESLELTGTVVEVSEINAGNGSYAYNHVHKKVRYTFPEDGGYRYYTIKGQETGVVMTSQYTYVYYYI